MSRPPFTPVPSDPHTGIHDGSTQWQSLISCPADFPIHIFESAVTQLIDHPEYNSTLILRSDIVARYTSHFPVSIPILTSHHLSHSIHRTLLPRRPHRDDPIDQYCSFYTSNTNTSITTLVFTPLTPSSLPYYHPSVSHLALRYIPSSSSSLQIDALPLPDTPTHPDSRLYRTSLSLLDTLHRYGWGALTNYTKRVLHDVLVPRDVYQDLYLVMRERHKHLVDTWVEVTDPLKHVFEDIGIATYLMLLWKDTFDTPPNTPQDVHPDEPWRSWPRPPGGFLDLGCGNGLLTHILLSEGYKGYGIDLRARTSWSSYPPTTQHYLHIHTFDPTLHLSSSPNINTYFPPGVFIIGNHADELTPYLPVLATHHTASGYLSIPCCAWSFDTRFDRSSTARTYAYPFPPDFPDTLNLGGDGTNTSSYAAYRIWLASLSMHCGWEVECENLRIPSTRNWAIIGRRRSDPQKENARVILQGVRDRALFKARTAEGKHGEH